ncbi:hypothetical protein FXB40_00190 [Bradyrhizobium rifense]|uniref:Cadherin domain-containing protein n=1 Tax=Bradyrhizobium rifense TaxID=515499 RepID=A0A5D3KRP8_9BRAD|nr:VCBS domain-containing protein [Bradyrhizobium rifense]TYM00300.1 hypothetical protein FXB40_00190 [Bradyrhizobium rifense]
MNYAGKFDAALSLDGQSNGHHLDSFSAKAHGHVPEGAVVIADPNLIFNGEFKRTGVDLVLSHDGHEFVVHDYFRGDKRAAIASPDGAHLTGDIVSALTGYVQVAQAAPGASAAQVIGHVIKLTGSATAIRNGVSVILNNGDNVEKGDVVSTGSDSTLGVTFIDGTVFGLSSNARMVLNEMVYDPNGSNNSSLLSLVAGTITFVAGETAKHGDMKIDTPVATMGIRGTAVLTEINFVVPSGGGDPQPQANFQVLVEPNGTTGSYILFDKLTLLPIATVNQAGQMIQISGGNVSITNGLLSPDVQKLITDVFTLKFTDNNTNTKLTTNFTDTITQSGNLAFAKTDTGATATATFTNTVSNGNGSGQGGADKGGDRIPGKPLVASLDQGGNPKTAFSLTERAGHTDDTADLDTVGGFFTFLDLNIGDRPTGQITFTSFTYQNAGQQDVTAGLSDLQKADIAATEIVITAVPDSGNANNGSVHWTYSIPDHAFDFLAAGETLTLTYTIRVDNNFTVNNEFATQTFTITITGTNDQPVITSSVPTITFAGGTSVPGGPLATKVPTSGTLTFTDVDLTDTHTVSVSKFSAVLPGGTVPQSIYNFFANDLSVSIASGHDSTGSGTGTINWSLGDIPVYLADFIPKGQVLTLTYTVTVTDSQGATSDQTVTVTITGTDAPAVVWIATNKPGAPSGGFWKDGANWETGNVPTISDDVIVITDQLHGLTPSYPVTIDAAAYAHSLTMNDFDTNAGHKAPEVINKSSLTIATTLTLGADSKLTNLAAGSISVGGKAEFSGTSVLTNAGYLTLDGGGDFASGTSITNSGTIELFGGTLTTLTEIHNAGGTLKVDGGAKLIVNATTVDGGTVTILGTLELDGTSLIENGALNNSGTVNVMGATEFAHETVVNSSLSTIEVWANAALTIDQNSSVTNRGAVKVDGSGKLIVNGATLDGGAPTSVSGLTVLGAEAPQGGDTTDGGDTLVITGVTGVGTITNNGELDLTGNAVLSNGILKNNSTLNVTGTGNALTGENVTNAGTIEVLTGALAIGPGSTVDNSSGNVIVDAALTLSGATISGGAIKGAGSIDVTGASTINGGATLSTSAVTADAKLTLDGITVSGSVITDNASIELDNTVKLQGGARIQGASASAKGPITNTGTLEIAGAATLLNDIVTNNGTVQVDDGKTLTLSGTEITGGTINNYSGASGGAIAVSGDSAIDGHATLNKGGVTVASDVTLTLDDATVAGTAITSHGTVKVDGSKKLTLNGASLTGGTLTVSGTLDSTGTTTITDANISNNYLLESTLGGLLALVATTSTTAITNGGTLRANGAELDINGEAVTNTGTLAAINDGTLKLISNIVTNTDGTVSAESGSTLDLQDATIDGGTVTIAGTLESTGTSTIDNADITVANTGAISVTSGMLTIDPTTIHAITNHGLMQVVTGGTLKLTTATSANTGGTVSVDGTSKLYLTDVSINGGSLTNAGNLYSVGLNTVTGGVTNTGTVEIQSGTLNLSGGLKGVGTLIIDDKATLELGGADAQTVTFAGGTNTLQLDKVAGQSFTGTIAGTSSKDGTFTITGAANISTSSGDALDFTASGGTSGGNVVLTPTGTLSGANNGVVVTQNGIGNISLTTVGDVTGTAGDGIVLHDGATGAGNITTTIGGAVSGAVGLDVISHGGGAVTVTNNGHITGTTSFGIHVDQDDSGAAGSTHIVNSGTVVGADGVAAISIQENTTGSATIDNSGTIGPDAASVTSTTYAIAESGGHVTINNSGHLNGNISVATATFNNEAGGTWTVSGTSVFGNASSIVNHGDINLHGASISGAGLTIENDSTINSWGTASISGAVTNTGAIEVHTGDLTLFGSLSGTGSVTVDAGATLEVEGTVSQTIALAGDGAHLQIDTSTFGGSIAALSKTDTIDLSTIRYGLGTSAVYVANADASTGGVLTVTDADGNHISLNLTGADYSNAHFAGSNDGTGHTLITLHATDDAPAFTDGGVLAASVSERAAATSDFSTIDTSIPATGSIAFTDIDLTDRPTVTHIDQAVTSLAANGTTDLTASLTTAEIDALKAAFAYQLDGKNNGAVAWHYSIADGALDFLGQDQTAKVVSTITLTDEYGKSDTADVTVTITGKNDAPTLTAVTTGPLVDTAIADAFSNITGTLVGADADHGETATLSYAVLDSHNNAVSALAGHYGTLTVNSNGTYDYMPDATAINALSAGSYTDTFTVQTKDAHGATGMATFTVNVTGANDTPVLSDGSLGKFTDTAATDSFSNFTGQLAGTDADTGDTLSYALLNADHNAVATVTSQYGALTVNNDGSYTYVPDAASINALPEGSHYSDSFTVQVSDAHGAVTTATYTVDLTGANDAPTLYGLNIGALTDTAATDAFSNLTGQLIGKDVDSGDTLTYSVLNADHHATTTVAGHYGSLTVNSDGSYSYVPNATAINALQEGSYVDTFTVQTTDAHGATGTATLAVDVTGANDAPVINVDQISVTQNNDELVTVHGLSVTDADAAAGETFKIAAATEDPDSNVSPSSATGSLAAINSTLQAVTYREGSGEPSTDKVTLSVTDGHGATDTVNLIFNLAESADDHVSLAGTTGKDVFFGTSYQDQFVFAANSNHDTILNFTPNQDHINLTAVVATDIDAAWIAQHAAASPASSADTLITIDAADTILLKGVNTASLHASDFIVHSG